MLFDIMQYLKSMKKLDSIPANGKQGYYSKKSQSQRRKAQRRRG